ncbi:MAG TPA: tocopherol cyclase family protein [Clostridia bacterium]|nr:tocopherol cyclase family protein [Clostridia bacterium]
MTLKVSNAEFFQGRNKKKNYFEGWYFKVADTSKKNVIAVIPGISLGERSQESHSFVQVIDSLSGTFKYFKYKLSDFEHSTKEFKIRIGKSYFDRKTMILDLDNKTGSVNGKLEFHNIVPFPKSFLNPGIMGPFSYMPFMQCRHGVINVHHGVSGTLRIDSVPVSFDGGYGYIEKDWGKSFPENWVWVQCNSFESSDVSVMFSSAKVPFLFTSFNGFISFIRIGERFYKFATYTGAKVVKLSYTNDTLEFVIKDKNNTLAMKVFNKPGLLLKAPKNGIMDREITESISAVSEVTFSDNNGSIIFKGKGFNTGMEISGDINSK